MRFFIAGFLFFSTPCLALTCSEAWNYNSCLFPIIRLDPANPIFGFDVFGLPAGGAPSGVLFWMQSTNAPNGSNPQTMQVMMNPITGGINHSGGPKTNYSALTATMVGRTSGQTNSYSFSNFHFSNGDTIGLDGVAQSWGRNNAGGDEGTEAITVAALQGDRVFTATVSGIDGAQISYVSPLNENVRGEDRPLIITTPVKIYSQGNITAATGTPTVLTGDGNQDWTTLGSGPVSDLFVSIDSQSNGALKLVVPVRSISDATHLVLDYVSEGNDAPLPVPVLPSTYKIFRGSNVTAVGNVMTVASAAGFSVGDTFEQPLGYAHTITGIHLHVGQKLPCSSNAGCSGMTIVNDFAGVPFDIGYAFVSGAVKNAFYADNVTINGLQVKNNPIGALVMSGYTGAGGVINMLGAFTGAGFQTFLSYDRNIDLWKTGKPISAPAFQAPAGLGVDCNGPPTSNFRVSKGIVVAC